MRIETLLQDPKVREALENYAVARETQGVFVLNPATSEAQCDAARDAADTASRNLLTALLAALAGEGENLEAAYKVAWHVEAPEEHKCRYVEPDLCRIGHECTEWHNALLRARLEAAAPLLTAPLLVRVATLEAEKAASEAGRMTLRETCDAATLRADELSARLSTVEAERDRLAEGIAAYRAWWEAVDNCAAGVPGSVVPMQREPDARNVLFTLLGETGRV